MIHKFLYWLTARIPRRLIQPAGKPYLERYYAGRLFGLTFYLHRFVRNDAERHVHNHPFNSLAVVLTGRYVEEVALDISPHASASGCWTRFQRVRWWNRIPGNKFHRIVEVRRNTWTLVIRGPRIKLRDGAEKGWGFMQQDTRYLRRTGPNKHEYYKHTEYVPWTGGSNEAWHKIAPLGRDAGREPA